MNVSKAVISTLQQLDKLSQTLEEYVTSLELKRAEWVASMEKDLDKHEKIGILPISLEELDKLKVPKMTEPDASKFSTNSALSSSEKDNSIPTPSKRVRITRQMKKSNQVVKPNVVKTLKHVEVKEEMPNANVRSTRTKKPSEASIRIKSESLDEPLKNQEDNRDSDVQIQQEAVETIVLEDSILVPQLEQIRTTRARTKRLCKDDKNEIYTRLRHLQTNSASKLHSNTPTSSLTSVTSNKAVTGLKTSASKTEFPERELRRKQKELDALHKKEALMLAQIEEKRKKREEREMKVQQVKIAKQKQLEMAEKAKHEKLKQLKAEREVKYMKQKKEMAKKRAAACKRAQEAKQKEEINNNKKYIPPYLQYETLLLPTPDCYDSDDPTRKQKINFPLWQMKPQITQAQYCMRNLEPLKKTFLDI